MQCPYESYTPKFINLSDLNKSDLEFNSVSLDIFDVNRNVVDLKMKHNSYNDIIDHCRNVLGIYITLNDIVSIIISAGQRAKQLNGIYDSMVKPKIQVLEIDEIFQGMRKTFLGAADKFSRYLLKLESIKSRSIEDIEAVLEDITKDLDHLELVITDGLPAYKTAIPEIFDLIPQLLCHVHAYRIFLREQQPINRVAKKTYTTIKNLKSSAVDNQKALINKRRVLMRKKKRLDNLILERDAFYRQHNIKKNSKKIQWSPELLYYKDTLNFLRASVRSLENTIKNIVKKRETIKKAILIAETKYQEKKQESLQNARLIQRFKSLLSCPFKAFPCELEKFKKVLGKSNYKMAPELLKFIKNNSNVFAEKTEKLSTLLPDNKTNTNTIEGIFGIVRPLLNEARLFYETPQSIAILEIFRFKCNFSKPKTGPNRDQSPLQRCGVHSQYETYLDALFPQKYPQFVEKKRYNIKYPLKELPLSNEKALTDLILSQD
jgi:hypothetical protein